MPELPKPTEKLTGWKQIADYLEISVRTAQTFEKEHGLPVRRRGGIKTPVYAFVTELDAWRNGQTALSASRPEESAPVAVVAPEPGETSIPEPLSKDAPFSPPEAGELPPVNDLSAECDAGLRGLAVSASDHQSQAFKTSLKPKFLISVLILMGVGIAGFGFYWLHRDERQPGAFAIEGHVLTVFDNHNRILWDYPFPDSLTRTRVLTPDWPHQFVSFDGNSIALILAANRLLYCFDRHGKKLWTHPIGREVLSKQGVIVPANYDVKLIDALSRPRPDGGRIVVGASRGPGALFLLELLTKDGQKVAEYYHFGWFFDMKVGVLGKNGHEDIFLAGVDSAAGDHGATLVVLDPDHFSGQSTTEASDPRGAISGVSPAHEKAVLLIGDLTPNHAPTNYCGARHIDVLGDFLEVLVAEGQTSPGAYFRFDSKLLLQNILPDVPLQHLLRSTILKDVPGERWQAVLKKALGDIKYVRNEFK